MAKSLTKEHVPYDTEAEQALIGALLIDGYCITEVMPIVKPDDFFSENFRQMFIACLAMNQRGEAINTITLAQELERTDQLAKVGGTGQLASAANACPTSLDAEHYANIVARLATSRRLIKAGEEITSIGYSADPDSLAALNSAKKLLEGIEAGGSGKYVISASELSDMMMDFAINPHKFSPSLYWGWDDLDAITTGLFPDELIIMGARPGIGKSQIAHELIIRQIKNGKQVLLVTLEMGKRDIMERIISTQVGIPVRKMREQLMTDREKDSIIDLAGKFADWGLSTITDNISVSTLTSTAELLQREKGLDLIVVDYLQLMSDCHDKRCGNLKEERVGFVSKSLKQLSQSLHVPVLAIVSLSRASEYRDNKRPTMADIRDSGQIESDANCVLLCHRDDVYYTESQWAEAYPDKMYPKGILEIYHAKNRHVESGQCIKLKWNPAYSKYTNINENIDERQTQFNGM
ncbi:replicative DNA helicase [Dehalococcoides sp. THU4]|uniref:replicative DNA helicase n=1 Tax=Dehalococcoides sp. THU4 TaxID=3348344 RepID=UPI00372205ED